MVKPTSVKTEQELNSAWNEYRESLEEVLERMARQRAARLSATEAIRRGNNGG